LDFFNYIFFAGALDGGGGGIFLLDFYKASFILAFILAFKS
jgi:hypothetical protein